MSLLDPTTDLASDARSGDALRIAFVVGSTRPGRRADRVAAWAAAVAAEHLAATAPDTETCVLDVADFALPLLDEPAPAAMGHYRHAHTLRWAEAVAGCDGFVFVTPEYNHAPPAALKNALDFLFAEWNDKAAGLIGYGVDGGARAVEHLRMVLGELCVADVRTAVTLSLWTDFEDDAPAPCARQRERLCHMLDEVVAWSRALRSVRDLRTP